MSIDLVKIENNLRGLIYSENVTADEIKKLIQVIVPFFGTNDLSKLELGLTELSNLMNMGANVDLYEYDDLQILLTQLQNNDASVLYHLSNALWSIVMGIYEVKPSVKSEDLNLMIYWLLVYTIMKPIAVSADSFKKWRDTETVGGKNGDKLVKLFIKIYSKMMETHVIFDSGLSVYNLLKNNVICRKIFPCCCKTASLETKVEITREQFNISSANIQTIVGKGRGQQI